MTDTIEAEMKVSPFRRWFGAGMVAVSGLVLLNIAVMRPPSGAVVQLMVWALAALLLVSAYKLWRDTGEAVRLVGTRLETGRGELIVELADVEKLERAAPGLHGASGFTLHLRRQLAPRWCMGLWWCAGPRAAFGGAASRAKIATLAGAIEQALAKEAERLGGR